MRPTTSSPSLWANWSIRAASSSRRTRSPPAWTSDRDPMAFDPKQLKTQADALQYMKNAERLGREDLRLAGFRRYCELAGVESAEELLSDVWKAIAAFELLMTERNGKTTRASRT